MWVYRGKIFSSNDIGDAQAFVYIITNSITGKKYIGKKKFWFKRTLPPLKGSKRKRRTVTESDWKSYYGSNTALQADVAAQAGQGITREILHLCASDSEATYLELVEQISRAVLLDDNYYNEFIGAKISAKSIKHLR